MGRRRLACSAAVGKTDVQATQTGLQARVLDRDQVCRGARLVQPGAQQRVAAGLGIENQVERDRLVAVGRTADACWRVDARSG
jgi:hypothetical protein